MSNVEFDLQGARRAGYNDDQIADAIAQKAGFDAKGARQAGFKSIDIINRLAAPTQQTALAAPIDAPEQVTLDKPSVGETLLIGAGRTTDRVIKGMQQAWNGMRGNDQANIDLKAEADSDNEQYAKLQKMRPIATAVGESLPSMAVPIGAPATALSMAARVAATSQQMSDLLNAEINAVGVLPRHWKMGDTREIFSFGPVPVLAITQSEPEGIVQDLIACLQK